MQGMRKFAILLVLLTAAAQSALAQLNGVSAELQIDKDQFCRTKICR